MKTLLIDPFSGASGDMLLAALVDAGAPVDLLRERLGAIPALAGVSFDVERVMRGMFTATHLAVHAPHEHVHRGLPEITDIIAAAPGLSDRVRERATGTFRLLAEAEARVHGTSVEKIHFHEVGALDAIFDIVGFYVATETLAVERFLYTTLTLGRGAVGSEHGQIPVPAPATLELLRGHRTVFSGRDEELVTPTAAAIVAAVFAPVASDERVVPAALGYGAGGREARGVDALPNILRVLVGETVASPREVAVLRCTIDDMNPEIYGHTMASLFEQGALEVYYQPVMMKKNRPGVELTVIAEERDARRLADHVVVHTTTLGVRISREERVEVPRRRETVETSYGTADVKVAALPGGGERVSPEFESCRILAERAGVPILDVFDAVRHAWQDRNRR